MSILDLLLGIFAVGFFGLGSFAVWYLWNSVRQVPQSKRLAVTAGGQFTDVREPGWTFVWKWFEEAKEVSVVAEPLQVFEKDETVKFADILAPVHLEAWVAPRPDRDGIYAVTFHWGNWKEWAEGEIASRARALFASISLANAQTMKGDILSSLTTAGNDLVATLNAGGVVISKLLLEDISEPADIAAATQANLKAQMVLSAAKSEGQRRALLFAEMVKYLTDPANVNPPMAQGDAAVFATNQVNRMTSADANALIDVYAQGGDLSALLAPLVAAVQAAHP